MGYKPFIPKKMKKILLLLTFVSFLGFVSCSDDDGEFDFYQVARPLTMSLAEFKANAVDITEPVPIVQSGKIYAYQNYIFINDINGVHVIDNSDPNLPRDIAFIKLEGNNDVSIKGNRLFADSYGDLVIFDISDIGNISIINRMENAIYENYGYWVEGVESPLADFYETNLYDYQTDVIIGWQVTTEKRLVSEFEQRYQYFEGDIATNTSESGAPTSGQGGSLARFKIVSDYLYVVDYSNINVFNISDLDNPETLQDVNVGWDIETIFNQGNTLFIGGQQGMYIYDISTPSTPTFVSEFRHGTACDPVVVDGDYAYVTLRGGNACGSTESGLYVIDVSNLAEPKLEVIYPMVEPYGLGVKNDNLFVCDGNAGLKVFDKSSAPNLTQVNHFENINTFDVIPLSNTLLMIGSDAFYQYEYLNNDISLISTYIFD